VGERDAAAHGPRLSAEEYEQRIIDLHSAHSPTSRAQERELRRRELELAIDHRLGTLFPAQRRAALWAAQERVQAKRLRLMLGYLFRRFLARGVAQKAQGVARELVREYGRVLSPAELEDFFGCEEVENPALPIDMDQLRGKPGRPGPR
jgi:hypothetical protein